MSAVATAHCLTGCAIGEILGLAIGTVLDWGNVETIVLAVVPAFLFGYGLTLFGVRNAGLSFGAMVKVALAADTISITVMEIIDNGFMMFYPGAMDAGLGDGLFWGSLVGAFALAFALAFAVTTPVNMGVPQRHRPGGVRAVALAPSAAMLWAQARGRQSISRTTMRVCGGAVNVNVLAPGRVTPSGG
ncbi:DUF4396 domain-containing protein [Embleya sp. NPDC020886]|uniref:DUF4396 domain-containing protein n=1 Tax=Embleya sp. NPDC020886 TaxID=3363980 RepID=UPI0037A7E9EA